MSDWNNIFLYIFWFIYIQVLLAIIYNITFLIILYAVLRFALSNYDLGYLEFSIIKFDRYMSKIY